MWWGFGATNTRCLFTTQQKRHQRAKTCHWDCHGYRRFSQHQNEQITAGALVLYFARLQVTLSIYLTQTIVKLTPSPPPPTPENIGLGDQKYNFTGALLSHQLHTDMPRTPLFHVQPIMALQWQRLIDRAGKSAY